ncbi:MAG TPA: hypothetical protein PK728_02265 [Bacillota bacterium]|nr:hypothetical protein [Bacillota bacterium]
MSLTAIMQSWCDIFLNKGADRAKAVEGIKKSACHVVKLHNSNRAEIGKKTRKFLNERFLANRKRVLDLIKGYVADRVEAAGILHDMRGKYLHSEKEPLYYKGSEAPQHGKEF